MVGKKLSVDYIFSQDLLRTMERFAMSAAFLLCFALSASASVFELPIATSAAGTLSFGPRLNATCELKIFQDSLCCLDSTFRDRSEAHRLLLKLLKNVPFPAHGIQGVPQFLHESSNGLDVVTRYLCDIPLGQDDNETPGLGCHRCLEAISREITGGMSQNKGRCANAWAVRFGYIYEPDSPWEEDTTWCHLDYWFRVIPSEHPRSTHVSNSFARDALTLAKYLAQVERPDLFSVVGERSLNLIRYARLWLGLA